jgi:hypothetical protein
MNRSETRGGVYRDCGRGVYTDLTRPGPPFNAIGINFGPSVIGRRAARFAIAAASFVMAGDEVQPGWGTRDVSIHCYREVSAIPERTTSGQRCRSAGDSGRDKTPEPPGMQPRKIIRRGGLSTAGCSGGRNICNRFASCDAMRITVRLVRPVLSVLLDEFFLRADQRTQPFSQ